MSRSMRTVSVSAGFYAFARGRAKARGVTLGRLVQSALDAAEPWTADGVPVLDGTSASFRRWAEADASARKVRP